jgi:hypothetical protein
MSTPTGILFNEPQSQPLSSVGALQAGAYRIFYLTGTTTPANVYADGFLATPLSQTPGAAQPSCTANSAGQFNAIYLNPSTIYRCQLFSALGVKLEDVDPYVPSATPTQAQVGAALWPQTAAESAASVTPTNYQYPELTLERYGGSAGGTTAANAAALTSAFAVISQKGGGTLNCPAVGAANGTYSFGTNTFTVPENTVIQGAGQGTEWKSAITSGTFLTIPSAGGRTEINDILIYGTSQLGFGITIGDTSGGSSRNTMRRVVMNYWATALRHGGGQWNRFQECEFGGALGGSSGSPVLSNNIGFDFNLTDSTNVNNCYVSELKIESCTFSNNANAGIAATTAGTAVTANNISIDNCTVQNNCVSLVTGAPTTPQMYLGPVVGFEIRNFYSEYVLGGTAPVAVRMDGLGYGTINDFLIGACNYGFYDVGGGACSAIDISNGGIGGPIATAPIYMASETGIIARNISLSGTVTLTGSGCHYIASTGGLASWPVDESTFNPVLTPAASGPITQSVKGLYSRFGNWVVFDFEITWSALNSASGNLTLTGFPIAANSGSQGPGPAWAVGLANGVTIASASQLGVYLPAGTTTASLVVNGASEAALQASALAGAGTIRVSGGYHV